MYLNDWQCFPSDDTNPVLGSTFGGITGTDAGFGGTYPASERILNPYVQPGSTTSDYLVFRCPSDDGFADEPGVSVFERFGTSYIYSDDQLAGVRLSSITTQPTRLCIVGDAGWFVTLNPAWPKWQRYWHTVEGHSSFNVVFLDGHAQYLLVKKNETSSDDYTIDPFE